MTEPPDRFLKGDPEYRRGAFDHSVGRPADSRILTRRSYVADAAAFDLKSLRAVLS